MYCTIKELAFHFMSIEASGQKWKKINNAFVLISVEEMQMEKLQFL